MVSYETIGLWGHTDGKRDTTEDALLGYLNPTKPSNGMWGTKEATGLSCPALLPRIRPDRGYP
jgi:hypothetical protein